LRTRAFRAVPSGPSVERKPLAFVACGGDKQGDKQGLKELTIGEMAELNGVTVKTLHLYHKNGLLVPHRVDARTGYRYYTIDQCSVIDMIKQFQGMGLTLEEIKEIVSRGPDAMYEAIDSCVGELDQRIFDLQIASYNARKILDRRIYCPQNISLDQVMLERLGHPRILRFEIFNPACVDLHEVGAAEYFDEWELNLRLTRKHLEERGIPLGLFTDVGFIVSADDLRARNLRLSGSYVFAEGPASSLFPDAERMPGGMTLTLYKNRYVEPGDRNAISLGIEQILDYADEHEFEVAGDFFGRIIKDYPSLDNKSRDVLIKMQVPVRGKGWNDSCSSDADDVYGASGCTGAAIAGEDGSAGNGDRTSRVASTVRTSGVA
jgi:DNA-binding transcriptional MerR regulator